MTPTRRFGIAQLRVIEDSEPLTFTVGFGETPTLYLACRDLRHTVIRNDKLRVQGRRGSSCEPREAIRKLGPSLAGPAQANFNSSKSRLGSLLDGVRNPHNIPVQFFFGLLSQIQTYECRINMGCQSDGEVSGRPTVKY